jgi:hypothetical protein
MGTKISPATKQMAVERLRQGLTAKQVSDLTGVSVRTAERLRSQLKQKSALPAHSATAATPSTPPPPPPPENRQDGPTVLDFQESPSPIEKKSVIDSAFDSLKGMLGISDSEGQPKPPPPISVALSEKGQRFVDAISPTAALAFITMAAWMWGQIGPEYGVLAPDETVARQIIEPLLRIYARHSTFMVEVNPDVADVGASLLGLVGYVNVSLKLYQQIKQEREEYEQYGESIQRRQYRPNPTEQRAYESENRASGSGRGYADVPRGQNGGDQLNGRNVRNPNNINLSNLPDKEARQYAALSRLSQLDYEHRARRSNRAA